MQDGINNNTKYMFNSNYNNYTYMYYSNSETKTTLENWYQKNIGSKSNLANKVASGNYYCEQAKVKYDSSVTSGNATMKLYSNYTPDFKCIADGNNKGLVSASIGLLAYDEVVYAGGYYAEANSDYYLYNSSVIWWMMSPNGFTSSSSIWAIYHTGLIGHGAVYSTAVVIRPLLVLKA